MSSAAPPLGPTTSGGNGNDLSGDLGDDLVVPFATRLNGVSGRLVRLGPAINTILTKHDYPEPVSIALGEALVLTALLGSALKLRVN